MNKVLSGLVVYPDNMMLEIIESCGCYASNAAKEFLKERALTVGLTVEEAYRQNPGSFGLDQAGLKTLGEVLRQYRAGQGEQVAGELKEKFGVSLKHQQFIAAMAWAAKKRSQRADTTFAKTIIHPDRLSEWNGKLPLKRTKFGNWNLKYSLHTEQKLTKSKN